ncbi:hypothetical protein ABC345_19635 [Shouchella sp. 1P09AA]|uniref:hypothetical protein n=1 Tax=unclassified Shouchella TaxID=2893065 RepID=UPI0039A0BC67
MEVKKIIVLLSLIFLIGCGNQTLDVRSALEGDSYLRNNIEHLSEEQFLTFASEEQKLNRHSYEEFKTQLDTHDQTRYLLVDNRIYRYTVEDELLYVADWVEEENLHKLDSLTFP